MQKTTYVWLFEILQKFDGKVVTHVFAATGDRYGEACTMLDTELKKYFKDESHEVPQLCRKFSTLDPLTRAELISKSSPM
jgi:hypothetical protein